MLFYFDLILNTFGGFLGYFLGSLFNKFLPTREKIDKDSYQKGESVSLLKRLCALSIDFINIILLVFLESYFVYKKYISIIWLILPFLGYFLIILIFKKSLGMKYLNLKFQHFLDTKVKTFNIIIYYFSFLFGYIILPILLILGSYLLFSHHYLTLNHFEY